MNNNWIYRMPGGHATAPAPPPSPAVYGPGLERYIYDKTNLHVVHG